MSAMTQTGSDAGATDEPSDEEKTASALEAALTAEELRRLAAHLPDAHRDRGATKSETARQIAERSDADLRSMISAGHFSLECSCGLSLSFGHPQEALREAKEHKSQFPTHFPSATDDETDDRIYG